MKKALVVGGASGIGLSIAYQLSLRDDYEEVNILDRKTPVIPIDSPKIHCYILDLISDDYRILDQFNSVDLLMITAGFGKLSLFADNAEKDIVRYFEVNTIGPIRVIKHFYNKLQAAQDFYCGVMVSIAGFMSSPFFSLYGASKAALKIFIESVNVELKKAGGTNQILNVSPGSIKGTSFNDGMTDLAVTESLAKEIITNLELKNDLFIPQYEEIFKSVLARYQTDFRKEGLHSYDYKIKSGRVTEITNNQNVNKCNWGVKK
jgi:short-subunit dehydrogenase